jgi:hypothetical protein
VIKYASTDDEREIWRQEYNDMLRTGSVPAILKTVRVVPIFKKGDLAECDYYRDLSIIDHKGSFWHG